MSTLTHQSFAQFQEEIFANWPTAKYLPENFATQSLFDYMNSLVRGNTNPATKKRRDEFSKELAKEVETFFGKDLANSVALQLQTNHSISTAHHYTPISSIKTLNPTLGMALGYYNREEVDRKNLIVLACASVSFINPWNPRAYTFDTFDGSQITQQQLPFFGRSLDSYPVISAPAYNGETEKQMQKRLRHFQSQKIINKKEFEKLEEIFGIIFSDEVKQQKDFVDQLTIQNFHIWKKIFANDHKMPNLIFLSQERVAAKLITNYHLNNQTIIHNMLFNPDYHTLILTYFNNIKCGFSLDKNYGTFLFWGMKKNTQQRLQLFPKDGKLVSLDNTYAVDITPEAIKQALETGELVPSVLLTFLLISLYYGMSISGGLWQPWYLSEAKRAYLALLHELGEDDETTYVQTIPTNDWVLTRASLAFLNAGNMRVPASGLDLILRNNPSAWDIMEQAAKNTTYGEFLYRFDPELHKDFCDHKDKKEGFLAITENAIEQFTNLDKKVPPVITLEAASPPQTT